MLRKAILALCVLSPSVSAADEIAIDGCAELARIVYDEVQSTVVRGPGGAGPWAINSGQGDIHVCRTAAKTVSRAFVLAVQSAGVEFRWADNAGTRDFCLGHYLSQCYPAPRPLPGMQRQFDPIGPIWLKVSQTVMSEMYNPYSSDEVHFRTDELRLRLGLSLRTVPRY